MDRSLGRETRETQQRVSTNADQPTSPPSKKRRREYEDDFEYADLETKKRLYKDLNGTLKGFPTGHASNSQGQRPIRYWPGLDVPRVDDELKFVDDGPKHRFEKKYTESGGYFEIVPTSKEWAKQLSPTSEKREYEDVLYRNDGTDAPPLSGYEGGFSEKPNNVPAVVEGASPSRPAGGVPYQSAHNSDRHIFPSRPSPTTHPLPVNALSTDTPVEQPVNNEDSLVEPRAADSPSNETHSAAKAISFGDEFNEPIQIGDKQYQNDSDFQKLDNATLMKDRPALTSPSKPTVTTSTPNTFNFVGQHSSQPFKADVHADLTQANNRIGQNMTNIQDSGRISMPSPPPPPDHSGDLSQYRQIKDSKPIRRRNPKLAKHFDGFLARDQPLRSDWQSLPIPVLIRNYPNHIWGRILRHLDHNGWTAAMIEAEMDNRAKGQLTKSTVKTEKTDKMSFMRHWILEERRLEEAEQKGEVVPSDGLVFTDNLHPLPNYTQPTALGSQIRQGNPQSETNRQAQAKPRPKRVRIKANTQIAQEGHSALRQTPKSANEVTRGQKSPSGQSVPAHASRTPQSVPPPPRPSITSTGPKRHAPSSADHRRYAPYNRSDRQTSTNGKGNNQPWPGDSSPFWLLQQPLSPTSSLHSGQSISPAARTLHIGAHPVPQGNAQPKAIDSLLEYAPVFQNQPSLYAGREGLNSPGALPNRNPASINGTNIWNLPNYPELAHVEQFAPLNQYYQHAPTPAATPDLNKALPAAAHKRHIIQPATGRGRDRSGPLAPQHDSTNRISKKHTTPQHMTKGHTSAKARATFINPAIISAPSTRSGLLEARNHKSLNVKAAIEQANVLNMSPPLSAEPPRNSALVLPNSGLLDQSRQIQEEEEADYMSPFDWEAWDVQDQRKQIQEADYMASSFWQTWDVRDQVMGFDNLPCPF